MKELTKEEIVEAVELVAKKFDAEVMWGTEDGFTWLTLYGKKITPLIYDVVSQEIADSTGRSFYFSSVRTDSIEGALNADFNKTIENTNFAGSFSKAINDYGTEFIPEKVNYKFKIIRSVLIYFSVQPDPIIMMNPLVEFYFNKRDKQYAYILSNGYLIGKEINVRMLLENPDKIKEIIETQTFDTLQVSMKTISDLQEMVMKIEKTQLFEGLNKNLDERSEVKGKNKI